MRHDDASVLLREESTVCIECELEFYLQLVDGRYTTQAIQAVGREEGHVGGCGCLGFGVWGGEDGGGGGGE